ncbi:glycoside hydrolase family 71 protein [Luteococcus sediminum]
MDSGKPVFAHYMPSLPVSLDNDEPSKDYYNVNYLRRDGEGGKFAAAGGFLRDRPLPREPRTGNWRQADLRQEVRDATNAGLSGFAINILELDGTNWERVEALLTAAQAENPQFKILLQPDMTAGPSAVSPEYLAEKMARLASYPATYRDQNGHVIVSPFAGDAKAPAWWQRFNDSMASRGQSVSLVPIFIHVGDNIGRYASVSTGMGEWGSRTPDVIDRSPDYAARAHALGKKWVSPVAAQDIRHLSGTFFESSNMGTLRSTWQRAIRTKADMALMVSWNDYSENSQFAPSVDHGYSLLSLNSYYLAKFRSGEPADVSQDAAYVSFRTHAVAAAPVNAARTLSRSVVETSEPTDEVEIQTILKGPAEVGLEVGGRWYFWKAPAGVSTHKAPLGNGRISYSVVREGQPVLSGESFQGVRSTPVAQDLAYQVIGGTQR